MITYEQQLSYAKVFGESIFYGADCVLALTVLYIQLTSRRLLFSHKVLLYVADVMFLLTSAHIALLLYETLTGTVLPRVLQAAVAVAQFQLFLGGLVLIWRVWVVWNRNNFIVILPTILLTAGFVVGMLYAAEVTSYNQLGKILPMPTVALTVVNTTLCTALIAGRLTYLDHLINGHLAFGSGRDYTYRGVVLMIIESGAVLTLADIASLVLERMNHPGLHIMLDISTPLVYMVPTTIIVLSHLKLTRNRDPHEDTPVPVRFATFTTRISVGEGGATPTSAEVREPAFGGVFTQTTAVTATSFGLETVADSTTGDDIEKQAAVCPLEVSELESGVFQGS